MKYFSLFSGVGGFELAINNVYDNRNVGRTTSTSDTEDGWDMPLSKLSDGSRGRTNATCIGYSEIDKYAISVYQYHYPKHKNYGNIQEIDWNTVPDFDLVVGGSPCQDLSVAGKQKGLSGARSGLFFEFVRCLKEKQPANFIWENVKGALSSSSGWDFARVQIEFSEAGYDVEWQVLNAKDFGVPQNRERIFVVGHLRGKSEPKVFPIRVHSTNVIESGLATISATTGAKRVNISPTLDTMYHKGLGSKQARPCVINHPTHSNDRVYSDKGVSPALNTMQGGRRQPKVVIQDKREYNEVNAKSNTKRSKQEMSEVQQASGQEEIRGQVGMPDSLQEKTLLQLGVPQGSDATSLAGESKKLERGSISSETIISKNRNMRSLWGDKENGSPSQEREQDGQQNRESDGTLSGLPYETTPDGGKKNLLEETNTKSIGSVRIRRLTCLECERLMSWPDDWTKEPNVSDTQRYKMCGNGVVSKVVEAIIERLYE